MIHHALGIFPFKDDFWSTKYVYFRSFFSPILIHSATETGCKRAVSCVEPYPALQALVSALSAGPVAPADKIGLFDNSNIMATCRADGVLLKPSIPARTLDAVFKSTFTDSSFFLDTLEHTYDTHSVSFSGKASDVTWHYLLAANTDRYYTILPSDLNDNSPDAKDYIYFDYFAGATKTVAEFNNDNPILIPMLPHKGTVANYLYYVIAPSLQVNGLGYTLLGETSKFVPASTQRITEISVSSDAKSVTLTVGLTGSPSEHVLLEVMNKQSIVEQFDCTLSDAGTGRLICEDSSQPSCNCM